MVQVIRGGLNLARATLQPQVDIIQRIKLTADNRHIRSGIVDVLDIFC